MTLWFGAAYYPEHWPEERWATDAPLMRQAGFNVVRIGEFAWCRMEPEQDRFDFDWMDRAIRGLNAHGVQVMIGTPTAGPPAWLVNADSPDQDCRQVYEDGVRMEFGARSLCCVNHPRFRRRSAAVAGALGAHFAGRPGVMGFQLDNELGMYGTRCYCTHCLAAFRAWLEGKYGTIGELNRRLGMVFGGGEFRRFGDVPLPRLRQDLHSPGLLLDSARFFSDCNASYLADQARAIREAGAAQPITTNVCHMFHGGGTLDDSKLFAPLDVVGWDCYPSQFGTPPRSATMGLLHAVARGYKRAPYWMLEQQSGSPMGAVSDDPRLLRLWTWQSLAHGAEMILYFRWRTARFGGEQYWRGILDHDGHPNVRYEVTAETGREVARLAPTLGRLERPNDAAILLDFDSLASLSLAPPGGGLDYRGHAESFFAAAARAGHGCDVILDAALLPRYRVVIAPLLRLMDGGLARALAEYVRGGGTLVASLMTATLDRDHVAPDVPPPWLLGDLLGVERVEWSSLTALAKPPKERQGEGAESWRGLNDVGQVPVEAVEGALGGALSGVYVGTVWCDHLEPKGAETLARFSEGTPAAGRPALTVCGHGAGRAYTLASPLDVRFYRDFLAALLPPDRAVRPEDAEADVEVVPVRDGDRRLFFVLNHDGRPQDVRLAGRFQDLLGGGGHTGRLTLAPYGVSLLQAE